MDIDDVLDKQREEQVCVAGTCWVVVGKGGRERGGRGISLLWISFSRAK